MNYSVRHVYQRLVAIIKMNIEIRMPSILSSCNYIQITRCDWWREFRGATMLNVRCRKIRRLMSRHAICPVTIMRTSRQRSREVPGRFHVAQLNFVTTLPTTVSYTCIRYFRESLYQVDAPPFVSLQLVLLMTVHLKGTELWRSTSCFLITVSFNIGNTSVLN